ncbi:MAG TPA: type II toxin-antitoxin system HicB family antitoxin [Alicyclobacillus sp.]|nr:type II toxin-antitoxin system HicB family antitoxin [Alicyclobacillus sp.]
MPYPTHYIYPVVVEKADDGGIGMYFPDFPGTAILAADITDGIKRAKEMLIDLLLDLEEQGKEVPKPSNPTDIELLDPSDRIVFIEVFMPPYRDEDANKTVTKNCTLPKWLRDAGEAAGLNFSQLLQYAIKQQLGLTDKHSP